MFKTQHKCIILTLHTHLCRMRFAGAKPPLGLIQVRSTAIHPLQEKATNTMVSTRSCSSLHSHIVDAVRQETTTTTSVTRERLRRGNQETNRHDSRATQVSHHGSTAMSAAQRRTFAVIKLAQAATRLTRPTADCQPPSRSPPG